MKEGQFGGVDPQETVAQGDDKSRRGFLRNAFRTLAGATAGLSALESADAAPHKVEKLEVKAVGEVKRMAMNTLWQTLHFTEDTSLDENQPTVVFGSSTAEREAAAKSIVLPAGLEAGEVDVLDIVKDEAGAVFFLLAYRLDRKAE